MSTSGKAAVHVTVNVAGQKPFGFYPWQGRRIVGFRQRLAAAAHYGVRRVTAREFRAWKRMVAQDRRCWRRGLR